MRRLLIASAAMLGVAMAGPAFAQSMTSAQYLEQAKTAIQNHQRYTAIMAVNDAENALVRVLSSPSYPGARTTVTDATSRLRTFCSDRLHVFWPDSVSIRESGRFRWNHVQGHRQLTDSICLRFR